MRKALCLFALTLSLSHSAFAQATGSTTAATATPALAKYDSNGDGQFSDQELQAAKGDILKQLDSDGDGQLSEAEKQKAGDELVAQLKARLDSNGDGQISEAEKQAVRQRLQQRRNH